MRVSSTSTLVFGLLANIATAVTPIPLTDGCASYPGYSSSTEPTDPFIVEAVQNGSPIEGHGLTYVLFQPETYNGAIGRIVIPINNQLAKIAIRCNPANDTILEGLTPNGWQQLTVSPYPYDAEILWGTGGPKIQGYWQEVEGQGPLYIGSQGVTTWGVMDQDSTYWETRLLGPQSAPPGLNASMYLGEVKSLLQVIS